MRVRKTEKEGTQVDRGVLSQSRHNLCLSKLKKLLLVIKLFTIGAVDCDEQGSAEMNHNPITY